MRKFLLTLILASFLIIIFQVFMFPQDDIKLKKFHYNVDVIGKSLNFRVFLKGGMVKNLGKDDFKLFVGGVETKIESFDERSKKIALKSDSTLNTRRLFVLIFNISDYRLDMKNNVDVFFERILKKGDRLIFISNTFYLNDRIVIDPLKEREKIFKLLELEKEKIKIKLFQIRNLLYSLLNDTFGMLQDRRDVRIVRRYFIDNYIKYLRDFKHNFLDLDTSQYLKLTQYLSTLNMDKWILSFYHIGGFYRPGKEVEILLSGDPGYTELLEELDIVNKLPENDLSRYFLKSGATVYSIFMKNSEFSEINLFNGQFILSSDDGDSSGGSFKIDNLSLEYKKIASNSENYFSLASKISGGKVFSSRKTDHFFKTITEREDIMYTIYFSALKKDQKIKLVPKNKKYKVSYDNQKKGRFMKEKVKDIKIIDISQINIKKINVQNGILNLLITNYAMKKKEEKLNGKVLLNIKILNSDKTVFNKTRNFKTTLVNVDLRIKLPDFKKGKYTIIVETKDLITNRNDILVYDFSI